MKSILLYVQDDEGFEARMQCALDLVRANDGHLTCLQVLPFGSYAAMEIFGAMSVMADVTEELQKIADQTRSRVEAALANEGVSWDFIRSESYAVSAIIGASYLSDVVVMSRQSNTKDIVTEMSIIGDIVMNTQTPLLVVPESRKSFNPKGIAMVAWNGSEEAANALRKALPLLAQASEVIIVAVERQKDLQREDYFPSTAASEYLSRHGISSELMVEAEKSRDVDEVLGLIASDRGAEYLVMGAYGHSRAREYFFGGVTRKMLKAMPVPLLLTH